MGTQTLQYCKSIVRMSARNLLLVVVAIVGMASAMPLMPNSTKTRGLTFTDEQVQLAMLKTSALLAKLPADADATISTCQADMHTKITPCRQYCNEWCWAATGTMMWNYYQGVSNCQNECRFVSNFFTNGESMDACCPAVGQSCQGTERDQPSQCNQAVQGWDEIAEMQHDLNHDRNFVGNASAGPMDQDTLDATLMAGNPIEAGFSFQGGGHAL